MATPTFKSVDILFLDHVELPYVIVLTVHLVNFCWQVG